MYFGGNYSNERTHTQTSEAYPVVSNLYYTGKYLIAFFKTAEKWLYVALGKLYVVLFALLQLIDQEINPFVEKWEEEGQFPAHRVFKILGSAGFLGVNKPVGELTIPFFIIIILSSDWRLE